MSDMTMRGLIDKLNKSSARGFLVPMEMSSGWPSVSIKNGRVCITIPYFKTAPGESGQIFLFPLSYSVTLTWPEGNIVSFLRHSFDKEYKGIDFSKPVGTFKHEAIKALDKAAYILAKESCFAFYDELIECIIEQKDFTHQDEMSVLLGQLMEPSLLPMYQKIAPQFFGAYCDSAE